MSAPAPEAEATSLAALLKKHLPSPSLVPPPSLLDRGTSSSTLSMSPSSITVGSHSACDCGPCANEPCKLPSMFASSESRRAAGLPLDPSRVAKADAALALRLRMWRDLRRLELRLRDRAPADRPVEHPSASLAPLLDRSKLRPEWVRSQSYGLGYRPTGNGLVAWWLWCVGGSLLWWSTFAVLRGWGDRCRCSLPPCESCRSNGLPSGPPSSELSSRDTSTMPPSLALPPPPFTFTHRPSLDDRASADGQPPNRLGSIDLCRRFIGVAICTRPRERVRGTAGTGVNTMAGPLPPLPSAEAPWSFTKLTSVSAESVKSGSIERDDVRTRARTWTQPDSPVIMVLCGLCGFVE